MEHGKRDRQISPMWNYEIMEMDALINPVRDEIFVEQNKKTKEEPCRGDIFLLIREEGNGALTCLQK